MISTEELEDLYTVLNTQEETLAKITEKQGQRLQSGEGAFRLVSGIGELLILNLLTKMQRLVGIFLLLEKCLFDGIKQSPIAIILVRVFDSTIEPYQKTMIQDILLQGKRQKYSNKRLNQLVEDYEHCQKSNEQPYGNMQSFKKQTLSHLQKLPGNLQVEVSRVLPDYPSQGPPTEPLNVQKLTHHDSSTRGFSAAFLRPVPSYVPISYKQLEWMNCQMMFDVMWDNSGKLKEKLQLAQKVTLNKTQTTQIMDLLNGQPLDKNTLQSQDIVQIFNKNPNLAEYMLDQVSPSELNLYYEKLVNVELSCSSLESMRKLILSKDVPIMTINYYVIKAMQKCEQMSDQVNQDRLARLIISLIKQLIKNKKLDPKQLEAQIKSFGIRFSQVDEVAKLYKKFAQTNK